MLQTFFWHTPPPYDCCITNWISETCKKYLDMIFCALHQPCYILQNLRFSQQRLWRYKSFRILKSFCNPKDNLSGIERRSLFALNANELTVHPASKDNMILYTILLTVIRRLQPFWRTKPTESWSAPYWDIIFWQDLPPTSIAGFNTFAALQVP
jgi:hypothetical protein